jgi:hypothetical protein
MTGPRQVVYTPVDVSDADYSEFEPDAKMESENAEFEQFKSEMQDAQFDAKITVGKKLTDSSGRPMGRQIFECFECGVDDYTFSQLCTRIREDFGTGLYQIQGRDSKGKYKFKKTVGILAPNATDNAPAPGNDVGGLIDKFSDAMQRQQMATEQMFLKLAGPQTGGDAIDQMTKMMGAMGAMMGAMGLNPQSQVVPKTLVEQLTEFKMIKELFGGDDTDGSGGEANLYSLLGKTVEAFGGPIAAALAAGAESGDLTPEGLATTARLPAPETKTDEAMEQEQHNVEMRKNIHILIQNAKTKIPPKVFAGILVSNTPPDKEDDLWEFLSAENCIATIMHLEPAAVPYREWFEGLRNEVIELMSEPEAKDAGIENAGQHEKCPHDMEWGTCDECRTDTKELQPSEDGTTIAPIEDAVAGVDKDDSTSDTDNGNTSSDT